MSSLELEDLEERDAPQNVALSRSVGWQDVESEWRVLYRAARVRGARGDGQLVAQAALGDYGSGLTLAKMVVASQLQGRGLGGRLLDSFLEIADARGAPIGLCATEQGRPLYVSRGFAVSGEIAVHVGTLREEARVPESVRPLADVERAVELDARLLGCDRRRMLRARSAEANAKLELARESGFALALFQGEHTVVGPIVTESEEGARALLLGVAATLGGTLRVDVPLEHVKFRRWLAEAGLFERARRVEMARGARRMPWQVAPRYALSSQAWG
jgi:GNAT superfamily N-acetyltransferase